MPTSANQRTNTLTLTAAGHTPGCPIGDDARDLLILRFGGDQEHADRLITEARAIIWRDPANPAEQAMTATDDALYLAEQGS